MVFATRSPTRMWTTVEPVNCLGATPDNAAPGGGPGVGQRCQQVKACEEADFLAGQPRNGIQSPYTRLIRDESVTHAAFGAFQRIRPTASHRISAPSVVGGSWR